MITPISPDPKFLNSPIKKSRFKIDRSLIDLLLGNTGNDQLICRQ